MQPGFAVLDVEPAGAWTTIPKRRRRNRRRQRAGGTLLAASEGEEASEGSSAGSVTHDFAADGGEELSSSMPGRKGLLGWAASSHDELSSLQAAAATPARQQQLPPQQQQYDRQSQHDQHTPQSLAPTQLAQQSRPQAAATPPLALPRQDHRPDGDRAAGSKPQLRSTKSDVSVLTVQTARSSSSAARRGGGGGGGLDGIPEGRSPVAAGAPPRRPPPAGAQPFAQYLAAELHPGPSYPTADVVWGQTERDRVYNALVSVPYQLERLLLFGVALCFDSFLAIFTLLPLRVGLALLAAGRALLSRAPPPTTPGSVAGSPTACGGLPRPLQQLRGDQLFDLLGAGMSLGVVVFLWNLNAGTLYFWMKDLTQELLKLSVLYTALELSDKICCSFGVDVLEALAASCTQLAAGWCPRTAANLACDAVVASLLLALHGATLMAQAMVFGVAMNSRKNTLVALLIAANFTEIKGTVLKRFDTTKLFALACQDVVERFHLLLILAFVLVEEMGNSGSHVPNPALVASCLRIYFGEVVIDITKHAVLGKFNEIRPGVYREYMRDLCERVSAAQSHNVHKLVGFEPFAPAALFFRIAVTAAALARPAADGGRRLSVGQAALVGALAAAAWGLALVIKLVLGFLIKLIASTYVQHYDAKRAAAQRSASRALSERRRATLAGGGGAKKEE